MGSSSAVVAAARSGAFRADLSDRAVAVDDCACVISEFVIHCSEYFALAGNAVTRSAMAIGINRTLAVRMFVTVGLKFVLAATRAPLRTIQCVHVQ